MFKTSLRILILIIVSLCVIPHAGASSGITYQGRVLKPGGDPLAGQYVQFKLQVRTPGTESCLLFEEVQVLDMRNSNGNFALTMNDGTGSRSSTPVQDGAAAAANLGLDRIFANRGGYTFPVGACTTGTTWNPNVDDGRALSVLFKDESMGSWEPIPTQKINYVPFAFAAKEAHQVDVFPASSLVRVQESDGTLGTLSPLSNAEYTKLRTFAQTPLTNGQVVGWNGSTWTSVDPIAGVQAFAKTALPTCAGGAYLRNNGGSFECTTPAVGGSGTVTSVTAGTGLSGGTITTSGTIGIAAGGVSAAELAANAVTTAKIADSSVTTLKLADGAVSNVKLADGSVDTLKLGGDSVTSAKIVDGTITGADLSNAININTSGTLSSRGVVVYPPSTGSFGVTLNAPAGLPANYVLTLPAGQSTGTQALVNNGSGVLSWTSLSAGSQWTTQAPGINYMGGSVGIGTTSPSKKFEVVDNSATAVASLQNSNANGYSSMVFSDSGGTVQGGVGWGNSLANTVYANKMYVGSSTVAPLAFVTSGSERMRVDSTGNVGIGTTSPTVSLQVGTNVFIDASGIGVGGTSPYPLYSKSNTNNAWTGLQVENPNAGSAATAAVTAKSDNIVTSISSKGNFSLGQVATNGAVMDVSSTSASGNVTLSTNSLERLRVAASGNVGIGTTSPLAKLDVRGSILVGDGAETCSSTIAGAIRYNGGNLQFCNGTPPWTTLGLAGSGISSLTGDVTGTGPGAATTTIAANAITTGKIVNTAVTYAKIQDVANGKILGRSTTGAGSVEELSIGTGLSLASGTLSSTVTDTFAAVTAACANTFVPYKSGGAWTCLQVGSANANTTIVSRDGSGNFAGNVATLNGLSLNNAGSVVTLTNPVGAGYNLSLPVGLGTSGQVLSTNGSGLTSWITQATSPWTVQAPGINYMSGNVGIGTTSPGAKLQVVGSAIIGDGASSNLFVTGATDISALNPGVSTSAALIQGPANNHLIFDLLNNDVGDSIAFRYSNANNAAVDRVGFVMKGSGNVGIGTTAPLNLLHLSKDDPTVYAASGSTGGYPTATAAGAMMTIVNTNTTSGAGSYLGLQSGTQTGYFGMASGALGGYLTFGIGDTTGGYSQKMSIGSYGGVAIGSTASSGSLLVYGGSIAMSGTTSGQSSFSAPASGPSINYTLPATAPTNGQVLSSTSTGVTSWISAATGDFLKAGTVAMTGTLKGAVGTAALPGYTFSGDTGVGFYHPATNALGFSTSGAERMRLDASGNVGIGTSSPTSLFEVSNVNSVSSTIKASRTTNAYQATTGYSPAGSLSATNPLWISGLIPASSDYTVQSYDGSSSYPRFVVQANTGNVGIGTTAPGYKLDVSGAVNATALKINGVDVSAGAASQWATNGASINYMTGNVGIGTTSPGSMLQVNGVTTSGGASGAAYMIGGNMNGSWPSGQSGAIGYNLGAGPGEVDFVNTFTSSTKSFNFYQSTSATAGNTLVSINPNSGLAIGSGYAASVIPPAGGAVIQGNVGIGTTAPTYNLETIGNVGVSGSVYAATINGGYAQSNPDGLSIYQAYNNVNPYITFWGGLDSSKLRIGTSAKTFAPTVDDSWQLGLSTNRFKGLAIGTGVSSFAGNVGIGTTAPSGTLDVQGGTAPTSNTYGLPINLKAQDANGNGVGGGLNLVVGGGNWGNGSLNLSTGNTHSLDGINPVLQITRSYSDYYAATDNSRSLPLVTSLFQNGYFQDGNSDLLGFVTQNSAIRRQTAYFGAVAGPGSSNYASTFVWGQGTGSSSYAESMRLDPTGNVGIGTTSPSQKLEVNGSVLATAYLYTSDKRLKTNFSPLRNSLEKLSKLDTVTFDWITPKNEDEKRTQIGLIAQDVQAQFPEAVTQDKQGWLRLNYMALVSPIIASIKELYAHVTAQDAKAEALAKQVSDLEAKNKALEARLNRLEKILERKPAGH